MRYYEIQLPARDNSGVGTAKALAAFESVALTIIGGVTKRAAGSGLWKADDGQVYRDIMIPFRVACTPEQFSMLLGMAFDLFPDQRAIFTADLGAANIVERPKVSAAA